MDYELSPWKYQNDDYIPYICGEKPLPENSGIVIKSGCVLREDTAFKGMGSAYGGAWRPAKPANQRFLGKPGEVKSLYKWKAWRYKREAKIGDDGKAEVERHYIGHSRPDKHTDPHDHIIDWTRGLPTPGKPINDPNGARQSSRDLEVSRVWVISNGQTAPRTTASKA